MPWNIWQATLLLANYWTWKYSNSQIPVFLPKDFRKHIGLSFPSSYSLPTNKRLFSGVICNSIFCIFHTMPFLSGERKICSYMPINGNALLQKLSFQYVTCSFSYLKTWAVRQSSVAAHIKETGVVAQGLGVLLLLYRTRVWSPAPTSGSLQLCVTLNSVSRRILCFSLRHAHSYMCVQAHAHTHTYTHALRENIYNLHTNNRKRLERSLNVRVSNCLSTSVLRITFWDDVSYPPAEELTDVFH